MTAQEAVAIIRQKISDAEQAGVTEVLLSSLRTLIDQIDRVDRDTSADPSGTPFGLLIRAKHETALAKYRVRVDLSLEQFKAVIAVGQTALKSMFLINGGAAIAVLAFVGHLATSVNTMHAIRPFAFPLSCFVAGLLLVTIASGLTYIAQRAFVTKGAIKGKGRRIGNRLNGLIIFISLLSVAAFTIGAWFAYNALANLESAAHAASCYHSLNTPTWPCIPGTLPASS